MTAAAPATPAGIADDAVLALRELSVVPQGDEHVVGDAQSGVYVVLPPVGVRVLELLASGMTVGEAAVAEPTVDVRDFAASLLELEFAAIAADAAPAARVAMRPSRPLRLAFSRPAWLVYGGCALGVPAVLAARPGLYPHSSDMFFLSTPTRSLVALTLVMYALAVAHEWSHWLAARAEGVASRITIGRRLYFLVLEIDLTGLWSLPRRRRYGPLLAGMAFDAVVLFPVLLARLGGERGWWPLGGGVDRALAAVAFVEVAAIVSQFWIFVRTDVYAVLITAAGCVNLFRVNQLLVRRTLRRATPEQELELAGAHPRDLAVARWFRWVYLAGLAGATCFLVVYVVPASVRLVTWVARSVLHAGSGSERFWEALLAGTLILSPTALTVAVGLRDVRRALSARRAA